MAHKIKDCILYFFKGKRKDEVVEPIVYEQYQQNQLDIDLFNEINKYRMDKGLKPFFQINLINDIAYSHIKWLDSQNMTTRDEVKQKGHYYVQQRFDQIKLVYPQSRAGENMGWHYNSAASYVKAWDASPGHHEIMNGDFDAIGIASDENFAETIYVKL